MEFNAEFQALSMTHPTIPPLPCFTYLCFNSSLSFSVYEMANGSNQICKWFMNWYAQTNLWFLEETNEFGNTGSPSPHTHHH